MSNWLAYLGGLVVAVLAALFAVPALVDWNGYRGVFEEEATRVLGREVRLGGSVNLRLLPAPYVSFEKMRISDPDSRTGEPLFRTESFTMWLALSPLLQGVLQANQIELKNPVLKLAIGEDGAGNWSKLQLTPGALPFVPADVALNSVKVSNGEIGLIGPNGHELATVGAINGELTADALKGPVRYRGKMTWAGEVRDVRFASAAPDANGDIRFKVAATGSSTNSSYILDGSAANLGAKLNISGELTAKIAPDLSAATRAPDAPAPPPAATPAPAAPEVSVSATPGSEPKTVVPAPAATPAGAALYDLRGKLASDASGFKLSEISITSDGTGPPQLVTGSAQALWGERTKIDLDLASRWIDLDAMFGTGKTVVPLEAARGLFDVLMRQLPATSDTDISLAVDQLNLGADQISNVRFAAVRAGGPLVVKDFQVDLPGTTHLSLGGKLAPGETAPKFEGQIGLKGNSLSRFLAWGLKRQAMTDGLSDGAFALNGNLKFSGKLVELKDAKVGIGDTPITAGVRYEMADRRKLALSLEGQKIDFGRIWPGGLQVEKLVPVLLHASDHNASGKTQTSDYHWLDLAQTDLQVGIKAGALRDGNLVLRNVEADISLDNGNLAMRQLKFGEDSGLEVELEGEAKDLRAAARGGVRGLIVAPNAKSASTFVDISGLDVYAPGLIPYLQRLAPLRLAGTLDLGARDSNAADLKIDGTVRGGRLIASAELDDGLANWRAAPANITARIEASDIEQAAGALVQLSPGPSTPRPGRIIARATGTPQDGLLCFTAIEAEDINLDYSGRILLTPSAPVGLDGEVKVMSQDARTLLRFAGLNLTSATAAVPMSGNVGVKVEGDRLSLRPDGLVIGETPVSGNLSVTRPEGARATLAADLEVGEVSVAGLLAAILDERSLAAAAAPPAPTPATKPSASQSRAPPASAPAPAVGIWPEQPFDFRTVDALDGKLTLRAGKLALQPGLRIADAKLEFALAPGKVEVTSLEGNALGGKITSAMTFAKQAAGVALDGDLKLSLPQGDGKPDTSAFALKYSGRALSPAALIADMKGSGELKLNDVSLSGMNPSVVASVAEAALLGRGPQSGEPLLTALRDGLRQGQLKLGEVAVPVTLAEGNLKLAKIELDRPEGRAALDTVVELASLKLDSEWTLEARLPQTMGAAAGKVLPPVSIIYTGPLQDITTIEPQISVAALERELTVRKMERAVEELERLRKDDEQRAKEERERLKAEQLRRQQERAAKEAAERAAAAAAAAVDDPQPAPDPAAGGGAVEQAPLPPAPQSGTQDPAAAQQQASGSESAPPEAATARPQQSPRPSPPRRRPPPKENWNPFTNQF